MIYRLKVLIIQLIESIFSKQFQTIQSKIEGIPTDPQRLVFAGKQLDDNSSRLLYPKGLYPLHGSSSPWMM